MSAQQENLTVEVSGDISVVHFHQAELDVHTVPELDEELRDLIEDADTPNFVFDLTGVRYIPTVGLGMLVSVLVKIRKDGGDFRLAGLSTDLQGLLAMVRLDEVFQVQDSVEEALASLA